MYLSSVNFIELEHYVNISQRQAVSPSQLKAALSHADRQHILYASRGRKTCEAQREGYHGESVCASNVRQAGQVELPPQTHYVDRYIAAKSGRPVIDARAKRCCCRKSTHQADRFYYAVTLSFYRGKVNAPVNIHTACECCHVTVVKRKT